MEFSDFPLDTQTCGFYMKDILEDKKVIWQPAVVDATRADFSDPDFTIAATNQTGNGGFSGFDLTMKRKSGTHVYTYFLPCALMVVASWVSFSVKAEAVPGRLGLLLTLLLMMINLTNSAAKIIPSSDSVCPLIVWIWLSISFVTFALVEYFVILTILKFFKTNVSLFQLKKKMDRRAVPNNCCLLARPLSSRLPRRKRKRNMTLGIR